MTDFLYCFGLPKKQIHTAIDTIAKHNDDTTDALIICLE
jgi:hypothetical protein